MAHLFHSRKKYKQASTDKDAEKRRRTWIRDRGPDFHPALAVETEYKEKEDKYVPVEEAAIEHLENILDTHDASSSPDEPKFKDCSWETVLQTLDDAKETYSSQRHFGSATVRGVELISQFKDLIPSEYGLSVVKGVLGILFETAKRGIENRAKILEAFETVPEIILTVNMACAYLDPTPEDEELRKEFCLALVKGLPGMIDVLLKRQPWYRKMKALLLLNIKETLTVDEVLSDWNRYLATLEQRIKRMRDKVLGRIDQNSAQARQLGIDANEKLDTVQTDVKEIRSGVSTMGDVLVAAVKKEIQESFALQKERTGAEAQTLLLHEFRDLQEEIESQRSEIFRLERANSSLGHENDSLRSSVSEHFLVPFKERRVSIITQFELLGILGISPHAAIEDLDLVLHEANKYTVRSLGQARWLVRTPEFTQWVRTQSPSLLLVDGHLDTSPTIIVSAISVFNSTFISSLVDKPSRIVLFFFATLHDDPEENDMCGPTELIRSLITQLLSSDKFPRPDLSFMNERFVEACQEHDIRALCELFKKLILQVPPGIDVYCIIDGLVSYELHPTWSEQIDYIAAFFEHVVGRCDAINKANFKVLLTFANHSLQISDRVEYNPEIWKYVSLAAGNVDHIPLMDV